jgi:hypothetical protein
VQSNGTAVGVGVHRLLAVDEERRPLAAHVRHGPAQGKRRDDAERKGEVDVVAGGLRDGYEGAGEGAVEVRRAD